METTTYDLKTAKRIAYFGAIKMDAQNYEIRSVWGYDMIGGELRGGAHTVRKGLTVYTVRDDMKAAKLSLTCTCPFYVANKVCKHTTRISWMIADEERALEMADFEDRIAIEAETRMSAECPRFGCVATP